MLKLCYKDYLAGRWLWLATSAIYVLYAVQPLGSSVMIMAFGLAFVLANLLIPFIFEDKDKTEVLYAGLPLTRATIVRGRYLLGILILAGCGLLVFGMNAAVGAVVQTPIYQGGLMPLRSPSAVAGFLLAGGLAIATYLPVYHKLGLGRANMVFVAAWLMIFTAAAGLERLASVHLKLIRPILTAEFLKDPGKGVISWLEAMRSAAGTPIFFLAVGALLALIFLASMRISVRAYERREF